jgi:hypothetical protein
MRGMRGVRDSQRSRVYAWENRFSRWKGDRPRMEKLEEVEAWLTPIWRKERGRVGLARQRAPEVSRKLWGQRRATADDNHVLKFPKWARTTTVILHEMAHRLTPFDEAHGPRFVGVFIGLMARWDDRDAAELMALADEMGVKYHVRSIGLVPVIPLHRKIREYMTKPRHGSPMRRAHEVQVAIELGVHWRQVRGAVMASCGALKMRGRMVQVEA